MKYRTQHHKHRGEDMTPDWWRVKKAETPTAAAIVHLSRMFRKGIKPASPVFISVAPDTPDNRHENGNPIFVHEFELAYK